MMRDLLRGLGFVEWLQLALLLGAAGFVVSVLTLTALELVGVR